MAGAPNGAGEQAMTFAESVRTCLSKYVDFNGVASRSEFWWFFLFQILVVLVLSFVSQLIADIAALALFLPSLAVAARRLHDTGRSGWWLLIGLIPVIGTIVLIVFWVQESKR
jgi:uncharacterized membrane protein YhaH (DUF805 family)